MYAQKNYGQILGNGHYSIAEAGCFLTSFCNLLERWGTTIDPEALNNYFIAHNTYLVDPDGAREDLAWGSIGAFDGTIAVSQIGNTPMPPTQDAIVKFYYKSAHTGGMLTHFCLVSKILNGALYIIDSYDGIEKSPAQYEGYYGKPVQWATYIKHEAHPVTPVTAPAMAPATSTGQQYTTVRELPGYPNANDAANRMGSNSAVPADTYSIFNESEGMINVTRKAGTPGWWINPGDNVVPASSAPQLSKPPSAPVPIPGDTRNTYIVKKQIPGYQTANLAANHTGAKVQVYPQSYYVFNQRYGMINVTKTPGIPGAWINPDDNTDTPAPAPPPAPTTPPAPKQDIAPAVATTTGTTVATTVKVAAPEVPAWQQTFKPHVENYTAVKTLVVKDASNGKRVPVILRQNDEVTSSQIGIYNDVPYVRTKHSVDNNLWYIVPLSALEPESETFNASTTTASRVATQTLKPYDRVVLAVAAVEGFVERFSNAFSGKTKVKK